MANFIKFHLFKILLLIFCVIKLEILIKHLCIPRFGSAQFSHSVVSDSLPPP